MSALEIIFLAFLLVVTDLAYWTQACLAASYSVRDSEYNWMAPFALGLRWRSIIVRYVPLLCSGLLLLMSGGYDNSFDTAFFAACAFFLVYVLVAGSLFYRDLKRYLARLH